MNALLDFLAELADWTMDGGRRRWNGPAGGWYISAGPDVEFYGIVHSLVIAGGFAWQRRAGSL